MKSGVAWIPAILGDLSLTLFIFGLLLGYMRAVPSTIAFLLLLGEAWLLQRLWPARWRAPRVQGASR